MRLRNTNALKIGRWTTRALLLLAVAAATLPLRAQQLPAQPGSVRQQLGSPAPPAQPQPATLKPAVATSTVAGNSVELKPVVLRSTTGRRDPFTSLIVGKDKISGTNDHLPPGKAGLVIATLRVDGVIHGPTDMIAIVSNSQQRVYFLREGDHLYDGQVGKITMEGITFHQTGKDPFGKPVQREINKRLYPTSGEQQ